MRDLSCSENQNHVHSTQICTTPILGVGAKTFHSIYIHTKIFFIFIVFIHQINTLSSCYYLSKVLLQKRGMGYGKVIHKRKRERKKRVEKNWTSVRDIENNGYSDARLEKKEMNKIALVLLQKYFQVSKERYVFKEHSRIRLATIYDHIHPHTCTS